MAIVRIVLGVIMGLALGLGVVMLGDRINHALWPETLQTAPTQVASYLETAPLAALIGLLLSWAMAAGIGAFAAAKIAARAWAGWIVGAAVFVLTVLILMLNPHPWWVLAATIVVVPLAGWHAAKFAAPHAR